MSTLRHRGGAAGYALGWHVVRALPEPTAVRLFDAGADWAARHGGPVQLRRNLSRVLGVAPEHVTDRVVRDSLRSYSRYWREAFRLPSLDHRQVIDDVAASATGVEPVDEAVASGSGAILALPHSGNWDMAGVFAAHRWGTFTTVAERLRPESLYRRFVRYRESLGFEILPASGPMVGPDSVSSPFAVLAARLRAGRVVCLLGERDLGGRGVAVTFFEEKTSMPVGPAGLALHTGAPLFPVHCWFTPRGWGFKADPPIDTAGNDIAGVTQLLADRFAHNIAAAPADWHMLQPLWWDDLPEARRRRVQQTEAPE